MASITGWYSGAMTMPVITLRFVVAPAAAAIMGMFISVGRGGLPSMTCSPVVMRSYPSSSALCANSTTSQ